MSIHENGSSPLTRGKHRGPYQARPDGRLIPAHAGKTGTGATRWRAWPAHPRSRGENYGISWRKRGEAGSSPLTRGKLDHLGGGCGVVGLIPAHAGKTRWPTRAGTRQAAHPRSRGENAHAARITPSVAGSSPLTRGKREHGSPGVAGLGLIPAHAGKTDLRCHAIFLTWAHPRSRGENRPGRTLSRPSRGSSPLTRGKQHVRRHITSVLRLIPAHAGKT